MDVIYVSFKVGLVTDCVFPKPTLPQVVFAFASALEGESRLIKRTGKATLYQPPTMGILAVSHG